VRDFLLGATGQPAAFASLIAAVIAASVALVTFAVAQLLTSLRERAVFLTPKLEALYLIINEVTTDNVRICYLAFRAVDGDENAREELAKMDHLDLYGHKRAKEIIMYIRLYFPRLARIHQLVFRAQRELNDLLWRVTHKEEVAMQDMVRAGGQVGHFIKLMEQEIVANRDALIKDRVFRRRFKETTEAEIEDMTSPPAGSPIAPPPRYHSE
jgi:hypothetical protein